MLTHKYIILDRDGVINHDSPAYIKNPQEWRPIKRSLEAIGLLTKNLYRILILSNQAGVSRGIIKYEDLIINFKNNVQKMTKYMGLEYESNMENFFITAKNRSRISTPSYSQVINPLYTTSINRWKNYPNTHETQKKLNKWIKKFSY